MTYIDKEISVLLGKTLIKIKNEDNEITFVTGEGEKFLMYHQQDCCENVSIEDIIGDLADLLNSPVTMAEEVVSYEEEEGQDTYNDSFTWTFYKLATINGYVTIRWFGESSGYYSEGVDFVQIIED
jgi:hypothetical protein